METKAERYGMLRTPTEKELGQLADSLGFKIDDKDLPIFVRLLQPAIDAYNTIGKEPGSLVTYCHMVMQTRIPIL